jgi:exopolysaccharide production protein ExoZ
LAEGTAIASTPKSQALQSIQILRAVAALGVLVYHTSRELAERTGLTGPLSDIVVGGAGVDLFFVISGFVMVYASQALFAQPGAPRYFLLRRIVRIVPLYWATTLLLLLYMGAAHRALPPGIESWTGVVASFAFWPYPRTDGVIAPIHALGWTLNYEMFFYAVFAGALVLRRGAAIAAIVALFVAMVIVNAAYPLRQPLGFWCNPIIIEFCFGMLIAAAYEQGFRLTRSGTCALLVVAVAGYALPVAIGYWPSLRWLQWGVPSAALVAALALADATPSSGALARGFAFLGDASYSLYLVHPFTIPLVRRAMGPWLELAPARWLYPLVLIATAIAAAILSYLMFEKPITRALQRRLTRSRASRAGLTS